MSDLPCVPQLCAEVKQTGARVVQAEQKVQALSGECERQQQRLREQEVELARSSTVRSTTSSLQEELQEERARLIATDKKVSGQIILRVRIKIRIGFFGPVYSHMQGIFLGIINCSHRHIQD